MKGDLRPGNSSVFKAPLPNFFSTSALLKCHCVIEMSLLCMDALTLYQHQYCLEYLRSEISSFECTLLMDGTIFHIPFLF